MPPQPPDKLTPTDPRITHNYATLNGQRYHYLLGEPTDGRKEARATIFCIHGWPDYSFGWRYQVPFLMGLGLRVVVPDMMGYGSTSAPEPPSAYTLRRASDDIAALAAHLSAPNIILLGHDWGGAIVYRLALYHPTLISAVISICTPYTRPTRSPSSIDLPAVVRTTLPNFAYQLQLVSGAVEAHIQSRKEIKQFLNAMYGGAGPGGESGFAETSGVKFDVVKSGKLAKTKLLSEEELDAYADAFAVNGLRGTLNWYRTRELNWRDELELFKSGNEEVEAEGIEAPTLFVFATRDKVLPKAMSRGMERNFKDIERGEVEAGHWALWQRPAECNEIIGEWLERKVLKGKAKEKL